MAVKARVLAAVPSRALLFLEKALGSDVELVPCHTFGDAIRHLREDDTIALVVCGAYFDESRMFDLLRWVKKAKPTVPFVCCRILKFEASSVSVEAMRIACEALGASFIDLPTLEQQHGADGMESEFRSPVLSVLRQGNPSARSP